MKQPKKLPLKYKKVVDKAGLVPENWMLQQETKDYIVVVSKRTHATRRIPI